MSAPTNTLSKPHQTMLQDLKNAGFTDCTKLASTLQGSIWSATHASSNRNVVIKATEKYLHSKSMVMLNGRQFKVNENILMEKGILKYLTKHRNAPSSIVKYLGFFSGNLNYYLIEEHGGTSCFDFIVKSHHFLAEGIVDIDEWHKLVKVLFSQMIASLSYVHSMNICHFDISLENWLINDISVIPFNNGKKMKFLCSDIQVKLCDFGLSKIFENSSNFLSNKYCGKMSYQSPEINVKKKLFDAKSNDVFCLGVCLFMMITGTTPWTKATESDERFRCIMNGNMLGLLTAWNRAHYVNKDLLDLFDKIFAYEEKRATLKEIKQHSWLKQQSIDIL